MINTLIQSIHRTKMSVYELDLQKIEQLLNSATSSRQRKMYQALLDKARSQLVQSTETIAPQTTPETEKKAKTKTNQKTKTKTKAKTTKKLQKATTRRKAKEATISAKWLKTTAIISFQESMFLNCAR